MDAIATQPLLHQDSILLHLSPEDDREFWSTALDTLFHDLEFELTDFHSSLDVYAQVGACSHWLRPHQSRWTAAGGFAAPYGYEKARYSFRALPEFDWFVLLRLNPESQEWEPCEKFSDKRKRRFVFRATLPTRTKRHQQAAIHTIWSPNHPVRNRQRHTRLYGFRKIKGTWQCVAAT